MAAMERASPQPKLLIVEDDEGLCRQYRWALPQYEVLAVHARAQALAAAQKEQPAVAVMDLGLPPDPDGVSEGFATLEALARQNPEMKVIVATSHGDREHALRAINGGAYDFCEKPMDIDLLRTIIDRAFKLHDLEEENRRLADAPGLSPIKRIVTGDESMLKVCRTIEKLANTNVSVLLLGESGTGKGMLARAIHRWSKRAQGPFVTVNAPSLSPTLFESELFGHRRGAFTGAVQNAAGRVSQADGGTLFVDEIGDVPMDLQSKLLRFMQDREYERVGDPVTRRADVRLVAATNHDLKQRVAEGAFREDLLYRLNVIALRLPALRERPEDILPLAERFLAGFVAAHGRHARGFADSARRALIGYRWPGNVRELRNVIERASILCNEPRIEAHHLALGDAVAEPAAPSYLPQTLEELERVHIQSVLARTDTLDNAAHTLGIDVSTLYRKRKRYGI